MPDQWFYIWNSQQTGPCTTDQIRGMILAGQLPPENPVWKEGMPGWYPIRAIPELAQVIPSLSGGGQHLTASVPAAPVGSTNFQGGQAYPQASQGYADEFDDDYRPRRKKKKKKKKRKSSGGLEGMNNALFLLAIGGGVLLITVVISIFAPKFIYVPLVLGWLICVVGGLWFLAVAFQDSPAQGLLCFFIPFYSIVYLVLHWDEEKKPFFTQLAGMVFVFVSVFIGAAVGAFKP